MPTFSYTTGNPSNLTGGHSADMNDIQGPFTDLRTAVNGNLDETNVPNLAAAFTTWKNVVTGSTLPGSGIVTGAGTYLIPHGTSAGPPAVGAAASGQYSFYFDPADYTANSRTTKMRVRWQLITGAVAPGITITAGLYPVASYAAAAGIQMSVGTVGTVVSGSTVAFVTPPLGTSTITLSSEFTAPAAANYVLGFAASGAMTANSQATILGHLQVRQV